MGYEIDAYKNCRVVPIHGGEYELQYEEYKGTSWTSSTMVEITVFFEREVEHLYMNLLPHLGDCFDTEHIEEYQLKRVEAALHPNVCLEIAQKYNLKEKASSDSTLAFCLEWLLEHWEKGFTVYTSY